MTPDTLNILNSITLVALIGLVILQGIGIAQRFADKRAIAINGSPFEDEGEGDDCVDCGCGDDVGCTSPDERLRFEIFRRDSRLDRIKRDEVFAWITGTDRDAQRAMVIKTVTQAAIDFTPMFVPLDDENRDKNVDAFTAAMGVTIVNAFEKVWPEARSLPGVQNLIPLTF